jgi:hypothetical protein
VRRLENEEKIIIFRSFAALTCGTSIHPFLIHTCCLKVLSRCYQNVMNFTFISVWLFWLWTNVVGWFEDDNLLKDTRQIKKYHSDFYVYACFFLFALTRAEMISRCIIKSSFFSLWVGCKNILIDLEFFWEKHC